MVKVLALGGGDEIGASSYLVEINSYYILLDAGLRPRNFKNTPNYTKMFEIIEDWHSIDAIFISHPHLDHVGSLPKVFENNPDINIFVPEHCFPFIKMQIYESLTHQKRLKKYTEDYLGIEYSIELVTKCLSKIKEIPFYRLTKIPKTNIYFEFWQAGHILGSASVFIKSRKVNIVYTGDISTYKIVSIPDLHYPHRKVDLLIMESTYLKGGNSVTPQEGFNQLYSKVMEITNKGNNVLIPSFALGKAQDIAKRFVDRNSENSNPIPVFLDGLVKKITMIYQELLGKKDFFNVNKASCKLVPTYLKEISDYKKFLEQHPGVAIIASSGMLLDGSKSSRWAEVILPFEGNGLFFTGFLDEESPGARLLKCLSDKIIKINGEKIPLKAEVDRFYISTHSPPAGLLNIVKILEPKEVILVHGNNSLRDVKSFQHECELEIQRILPIYRAENDILIEIGELI